MEVIPCSFTGLCKYCPDLESPTAQRAEHVVGLVWREPADMFYVLLESLHVHQSGCTLGILSDRLTETGTIRVGLQVLRT